VYEWNTTEHAIAEKLSARNRRDAAGNVYETSDAIELVDAASDTTGPITYAKATSGRKGHAIALHHAATDDLSSLLYNARVVVRNHSGKVVKTSGPGSRPQAPGIPSSAAPPSAAATATLSTPRTRAVMRRVWSARRESGWCEDNVTASHTP